MKNAIMIFVKIETNIAIWRNRGIECRSSGKEEEKEKEEEEEEEEEDVDGNTNGKDGSEDEEDEVETGTASRCIAFRIEISNENG